MFPHPSRKDKGFSSKNKVQQYHADGTETITMMGKPFRVLQKVSDVPAAYATTRRRQKHTEDIGGSSVYLAENSPRFSEFPRHLAIKRTMYRIDQITEAHKEIEIITRIKDKNIVRVFHAEVSRSEGKLGVTIAMEYCSNNLYRRIRSGTGAGAGTRLSESEICHVLLAITSAVGYLHTQQPPVAHRDIRPENILINNNFTGPAAYKLTNFGNATTEAYQCESREEANMAIADIELHTNPGFRSPEMADPWSKRRISEKSDMWSLGVLLYYMMYLKLPFEPTNMALSGNPKVRFPAGSDGRYTGSLRVAVEHLLDPNPDERWDVFALTNFLRFDEDISRHLGTFIFSKTEWPEGWEEQDVKVMNRDVPAKAPPVHYDDDLAHEQLDGASGGAPARTNTGGVNSGSPTPSPSGAYTTGGSGSGGGARPGGDDAAREAMMVLGGEDDDDPEMAQYRAMIIKEQEEAWAAAKAAAGRPNEASSGGANNASPPAQAAKAEEPKKDVFDDLFAGPAAPPAAASAEPPASALDPFAQPPQQQQQQQGQQPQQPPQPQKDQFSADDLFSGPPMQQQQQQQQPFAMAGNWASGAPNMGGQMNNNTMPQYGGGWGANPNMNANNNNNNFAGGWAGSSGAPMAPQGNYGGGFGGGQPSQQQQQPNLATMNFMAPPPGQQQQQQGMTAPTNNNNNNNGDAPKASRKDPFADLFS